jgi:hypothetical protein
MKRLFLALRGLTLGLAISGLNLAGLLLMLLMLGGLGGWSTMQFVGVFGLFEIGTAIAFVLCPNIWRLPVIEAETSDRTQIRLAASVVFLPHWAGGAKAIAGVAMLIVAARSEGWGPESLGLAPFVVATGALVVALSALAARWGVARPDIDVVHFVVRRPSRKDIEIPGLSISAAVLQILLGAFTLPTIKLLPASAMYQPEIAPSPQFLAGMVAAASIAVAAALWAWRGRISLRAPREQQRKAEEPA